MKKVSLLITLLSLIATLGAFSSARAQTTTEKSKLNVAILVFDGVQIIDYTGPYEVLGSWRRRNVYTVAEKPAAITTNMGMRVIPNYTFQNQPKPDILIIPGGGSSEPGAQARGVGFQLENQNVIKWIQDNASQAKYVMSVCNGAFLLAKAGLLDGLEATTTAGLIEKLRGVAPKTKVVSDKRFVDNGKIITTGGLSSGIDGALHLVEKLDGKGWAQVIAYGIEYNWQPEAGYARAALADMKLPSSIYDAFFPGADPLSFAGGVNSWEEKWGVSHASASELLKLIDEKWATDTKWKKAEVAKAADAASTASHWKLTDEKGQVWNGIVSLQPLSSEKNRFLVTLKIARGDANSSAQLK
jgi:putative intracellular protease/amidase